MSSIQSPPAKPSMKMAYSSLSDMKFTPGRRSWIKYRDLGVAQATDGAMRAEVMHIDNAETSKPTGWHYHTADMQFLFVTEGWVKIEFPELGVTIVSAGESIMIPGGTVHQELESSEPLRLLEISVPAKMGTVPVETPEWGRERAENYGQVEPVSAVAD